MQMADISLNGGDNIILVIDTDSYSGNFERQLCGFTTGVWDEDRAHGQDEAEEAEEDFPSMIAAISAKVTTRHHAEYGDVSNTIRATPGRLNNGMGKCFDAEPGQTGFPAYESVAIFLRTPLTAEELAFVEQRARQYGERQSLFNKPFEVKAVYQVNARLVVEETRL